MNNSETAHCRLCANQKPYSKLVDLQADQDRRGKVMEKLIRLSLEITNLNSSNDVLPKTICFPCIDSLDTAFDFVISVETSQSELSAIMIDVNLKDEVIDDFLEPYEEMLDGSVKDSYDVSAIKDELDTNTGTALPSVDNSKSHNEHITQYNSINTTPLPEFKTWKDYNWLCAYCGTVFPHIDELKQHSIMYHTCCNPYRCSDCNIRKLNLDNFIKHVKRHRKHLKLSCYKCHMTFSRQYDMLQHTKSHLGTEFKCSGCNETFSTMKESSEHSERYNKDRRVRGVPTEHLTADFTCVFCQKKFKHKGGLSQHLLTHTDRKRNHTCEKCGKCFLNKSTLTGHMMMHDGSRPHQCEICKRRFRTISQLRSHIGIHDGKKTFSCELCGRLFRLKSQLNSHSIIHTDSLPYSCMYCKKGFRFKTILNQHVRQHTGLRPYECQICHRDFTNWPNYNKHMKRRHDMNMAKRKNTPGGMLPINPLTGEVDREPETNKTAEWKKKILNNSNQPGRPKSKSKLNNTVKNES